MKNKSFMIVFILFIIAAFFMFNFTNKPEVMVSSYFPCEEMTLEYSGGFENSGMTRMYNMFDKNLVQVFQEDAGAKVVMIYSVNDMDIMMVYRKEVVGDFKENYLKDFVPNASDVVLKAPLKKGNQWINDNGGIYEITDTNKKIKTKAGKYRTIEVTYTLGPTVAKMYFAKNIGFVKWTFGDDMVMELIGVRE